MKMFKRAIAFILSSILLLSTLAGCGSLGNTPPPPPDTDDTTPTEYVFNTRGQQLSTNISPVTSTLTFADHDFTEEVLIPRDGYVFAPTMFGATGVDVLSSFYLRTPYDTQIGAPPPSITIDGQPQPTITLEDARTFLVTPVMPLSYNAVYIFRLTRFGQPDVTWAFQTSVRFEIVSTLPRNQANNVPVRTGIEVNFSMNGDTNISDHFSIYPYVEGRFIYRDNTAIFMPTSPLQHEQIYTVTISAGITLPGTSDTISTDHVFSFETAPPPASAANVPNWTSTISFSNRYIEFPSFEPPSVNFWLSYNSRQGRPAVTFGVYRIDDRAQAISAVNGLISTPSWSHRARTLRMVDTSGLHRVYSTTVRTNQGQRWTETLQLPSNLDPGFYVVNATVDGRHNQMIIQISDLAVQVVADEDMALLWVHDMITGRPAADASIRDPRGNRTYDVSSYGIAIVERMITSGNGDYLIITAADGKEIVVFVHGAASQSFHRGWGSQPANDNYWTVFQLDRTLFQRSDTIHLWGFVQNRLRDEDITHVTAIITEASWWGSRDTLHRQNIHVVDGSYDGQIRLPHLDPGMYEIAIFHGDIVISSMFFSVQDYVKPPYQLTVSADHAAIFVSDTVTFTARTEFFEGTPVPDLSISYGFQGRDLTIPRRGTGTTNLEGVVEMSARPTPAHADVQGERSMSFSAEATLPEIGWVREQASVRVFVNDIHVRPRATRTDNNAMLTVNVNDITLDRLNNGTSSHRGDFLCAPTAGQTMSVRIYEIYWERVRDGEFYNFATRQVVPRYRHVRRERFLEQFDVTTDANGLATRNFQVPNRQHASYQARLTTTDGNGRRISHTVFIGRDFSDFHRNASDDRPFLYGARSASEGYDIGDLVELTVMLGAEPVTRGNFLFVVAQGGILSYHVGTNPLEFAFTEQHVPNATVFAYHFNGHTYTTGGQMSQRLHFNTQSRQLVLNVSTCQETYRPGGMSTITITATDLDGNPKAANINISLVDEALFALMDYSVDTLTMLYRRVSDHLRISMATHRTFVSDGIDEDDYSFNMWGESEPMMRTQSSLQSAPAVAGEAMDSGGGDQARIRERFEDTAIFKTIRTNELGQATFNFQLPDNITSWRMTASGISTDLYAGNTVQNIRVTQPMFLHYTFSSTFLTGDTPSIGVNVYGTSLSGGERVNFEVWREDAPHDIRRASGVSFERVNIPLWEMTEEGHHAIVVRATVGSLSDAVRHPFQVLNSHRQVDIAVFYDVTPNTIFDVNQQGMTDITFTDRGRGQFLHSLLGMRWSARGARLEGLVARREATRLISTHFPDTRLFSNAAGFDPLEYQTPSGGLAILPYADADLQVTVMLMPFVLDEINVPALRSYLNTAFTGRSSDNRMLALYGLALLGEPVLLDLQRYAEVENLSVRNVAYVALGFAALGETQTATNLYNQRILPYIQRVAPYYRVNVGQNRNDILDATSVVALLAAQLGMPQSLGLHNYATRRHTCDFALNLERLAFINHEIENFSNIPASITYTLFGQERTRDLSRGRQFNLRIPAQNMHEFNLVSVTGDVGAVSIVRTPLENIEPIDDDITITRQFFRAGTNIQTNTFAQDELVRVQITIDYSARAMQGSYVITDFLPAGLVPIANSARFGARNSTPGQWRHVRTEGQRVTFFDHNSRFDREHVYYYYARVVNPGVFRAEGTLVQSLGAREYMSVGESVMITIE